jgi:PAS domain-containing protein
MLVLCSYCQKTLRSEKGGRSDLVSHGMCEECGDHFEKLWRGMQLDEYLDGLPGAVLLVDGDGRVLAANRQAGALLGHDPASPRGLLGGEAMACSYSRLPGGCGKTIHCRDCTIRNTVTKVAKTGAPVRRVPAFLKTDQGRVSLEVSARPVGGLVEVTVVEARLPGTTPLPR